MAFEIIRYVGALLLVLALIGVAGVAARKWGVPGVTRAVEEKRLAVIETLLMGPRQRLFIVRREQCRASDFRRTRRRLPDREYSRLRPSPRERNKDMSRLKPLIPVAGPGGGAARAQLCLRRHASGRRRRGRQWRLFHRSQRQRPFHRPHGADYRPDHGAFDRALDPHHDDQFRAHGGGAVAAAHGAGPAAEPAQQRAGVAGDVPHFVRDDAHTYRCLSPGHRADDEQSGHHRAGLHRGHGADEKNSCSTMCARPTSSCSWT